MHRFGRFIEISLLLLLKEERAHGYMLMDKLIKYNLIEESINIGAIYRGLRAMENNKLINSTWEDSDQGPKKRLYSITEEGEKILEDWIDLIIYRRSRIDLIIDLHEKLKI